jgi:hypothetical protein
MEAHLLFFSDAEASMQKRILLGLFFLFGLWAGPQRASGQTVYTSSANAKGAGIGSIIGGVHCIPWTPEDQTQQGRKC